MVAFFTDRPAGLAPDNYFFRYAGDTGQLVIQQRMDGSIKVTMPVADEGIPWWKKSTSDDRKKIVGSIAPELSESELELAGFYPVRMIHAIDYAIGNVVLIGDAAHAIHPARGQGLNMGIASLKTLLPLIPSPEEITNPEAVKSALTEYQRIQKPLNERIIARNHTAAMEMEMGANENRAFVLKKSNAAIKQMAGDVMIRSLHMNEATGYHFGVPAKA
jgi:2-polyprenyl-6-methoxyphenol hydroxylase-like FAD-dependent oxidoreductase